MTVFTIPAETFIRLAGVAIQPDEPAKRECLRSVRIEHHNGRCIAVASNSKIIAGEFIADVDELNEAVCVTIAPSLMAMAREAAAMSQNLLIAPAPGWTVITTTGGAMYPANGAIAETDWPDWRALIPGELPAKNNGCFSFSGVQMARLCASAPSGFIRCARHIDMTAPTIVRDTSDENWFGIFLVTSGDQGEPIKPATVPDYLR